MCTLDALTQIGRTLRTVSQRPKVVLFIGTYVRSFEAMKPTPIAPAVPGRLPPTFSNTPGNTGCSGRLQEARRTFERAMGEANVTHVIDPVGVDTEDSTPLGPGRLRERLDSLPVLADSTGGRTVTNTSAPEAQVAGILDESSSYYVVGFTPAPSAKRDATRRIEVRVRPRGVTVRARNQYNLAEQPAPVLRPDQVLTRAIADVLPAQDVRLQVSAVPMIAGSRSAAVVVARVGGRPGAGAVRPTEILTAAFTPRAAPVTSRRVSIPPAAGDAKVTAGLGLISSLALEPGRYEIRVATGGAGEAAGSVHTFVEVPDFRKNPLSMSGVLLHVSPEEPAAPPAEIEGVLPFVPTARRTFSPTDTVSAFVQVGQGSMLNDALQPVTLRLRIDDARGSAVRNQAGVLTPAEFSNHRTANARLPLPLRELPRGQYMLMLEATAGDRRAERLVRFEMR